MFLETHGKFRNIASHLNGGVICLETSNLKIFRIQGRKGVGRKKNPCATATLRKKRSRSGLQEKISHQPSESSQDHLKQNMARAAPPGKEEPDFEKQTEMFCLQLFLTSVVSNKDSVCL